MSTRLAADLLGVGASRQRQAAGHRAARPERNNDLALANERAMRRFTRLWRLGVVAVLAAGVMVASALAAPSRIAEEELIWLTPYHSRG
jgi:hypothetical protein